MAKKPFAYGSRRTNNEGEAKAVSEHNFRHVDQIERWKQEYVRYTTAEEKLASLSKLSYDPVDYALMLVPAPWVERQAPDFNYLIEEARIVAESKFFTPIAYRFAGFIVSIVMLMLSTSSAFLWISGVLTMVLLASLFVAIQQRYTGIEAAVGNARAEAQTRTEQMRQMIAEEKRRHEEAETERISVVEKLMAGDIAAIFTRLDHVLSGLSFPVPVEVTVNIYAEIPLIKIVLPPKSIIPLQSCAMLPSGRLKHTDKEARAVNKQYVELCAAVMMQIMSVLYANIPSFDRAYVWGLTKNATERDCVFELTLSREELAKACLAETGIAAVRQLQSRFETDTALNLKILEADPPPEWEGAPQQLVRSMHINLAK